MKREKRRTYSATSPSHIWTVNTHISKIACSGSANVSSKSTPSGWWLAAVAERHASSSSSRAADARIEESMSGSNLPPNPFTRENVSLKVSRKDSRYFEISQNLNIHLWNICNLWCCDIAKFKGQGLHLIRLKNHAKTLHLPVPNPRRL